MTSVSSMIGADDKLAKCEPVSLFMACLTAAALDLPINKNLGFAHIVPYDNNKKIVDPETGRTEWTKVLEAQFQMGWRGYVQLAQRSGQYKTIAATAVYAGQLVNEDPLLGNTYDWKAKQSDDVLGYVAMFKLVNGFEKELYMTLDEVTAHADRYSKAYAYDKKNKYTNSPWSNNFDAMALKTVVKLLISKWGPMSVDMQKAVELDSSVIKEDGNPSYVDGELASVGADDDKKAAIIAANQEENDTTESDNAPVTDEDLDNLEAAGGQATLIDEPKQVSHGDNPSKRATRK
jgi:recombination protein RecT